MTKQKVRCSIQLKLYCRSMHLRLIKPFLVLLSIFVITLAWTRSQQTVDALAESRPVRSEDDAVVLVEGGGIAQELGAGNHHTYAINLSAGQYVRILISKADLDILASLSGPSGQTAEFISRRYGPLQVSCIASSTGTYRLEIRSLERGAERRHYEASIEELRNGTPQDQSNEVAVSAFAKAEKLRTEWKEPALRDAIKEYTSSASVWRFNARWREAAGALKNVGETYFILSEYPRALEAYREGLRMSRIAGDKQLELEALNGLGYVYEFMGDNQRALRHFTTVLDYCNKWQPPGPGTIKQRIEAQALNGIGEVYYSMSNIQKALKFVNRALAIWTTIDDRRGQALAQLNLGYVNYDSGSMQEAANHYQHSLLLWQTVEDRRGEALSRTALGGVQSYLGEKQLALNSHIQARQLFRAIGDRQGEAATFNGIGKAYEDLNEPQVALDNYNRALNLYREIGNRDYEALGHYYVGSIYRLMGDETQALASYNRSIQLSREVGDLRVEAYALKDIGIIYSSSADKKQRTLALKQYLKVLELNRKIKDLRGQAYTLNGIGYIHYLTGDLQSALAYYKQALPLSRAAEDREEEISTLYNIARAERALGNLREALGQIESSISLIETLRTKVDSHALRASYFASVHQNYELYIDLLMQMHQRHPEAGFAVAALQASERARARALLETLTDANVRISRGVDSSTLERERLLQQSLDAKAEYRMRVLSGQHTEDDATETAREIRELTTQYQEVQAQIKAQSPRYATLMQPQTLLLEDIQAEVRDGDTLLLEYALGDERSYLWAVTSNAVASYQLPGKAVLEDAARRVYNLLISRQPVPGETLSQYENRVTMSDQQYREQAAALSQMLLSPVASNLSKKRLLIISDGALQYVPFEALPLPVNPASNDSQSSVSAALRAETLTPIISEHEVVKLPSVSILLALRREKRKTTPAPKTIAVLADPVFDDKDPRLLSTKLSGSMVEKPQDAERASVDTELLSALRNLDGPNGGNYIPRLPSTLREAEAIMAVTPAGEGMMATGLDASRATAVGVELSKYRIVHFATHGIIDSEHPELSGIILSLVDKQGQPQNGFLRLHDIYNLNLSADLVVLSACRTGLGKEVRGEGLVGLTGGFMYAGSKSVIASLWKVDDEATAALMGYFYRAMLKDGLPPAAALRLAKVEMWKQNRWRTPYYWAAFELQGDYKEIFITEQNADEQTVLITALIILVAAAIGYYILSRFRKGTRTQ